jgi:hypothetical protein
MVKILKLITCICLAIFLCSCNDNEDEILKKAEQITYARSIKENNPIKNKKTITLNDAEEIIIFEFEGCEYIMYKKYIDTRWGVLGLTHKGNCKNCSKNIKN